MNVGRGSPPRREMVSARGKRNDKAHDRWREQPVVAV
jgi:hypothetical protein